MLHDYKWGCDNSISCYYNLGEGCMGISQTIGSLYRFVTTAYGVSIAPILVMPDFNPNNSQTYLKWVLSAPNTIAEYSNCT
jgi:hypothetical protein